jgi:hypothetical protein
VTFQATKERGRLYVMPRREWEAPHFHLERAAVETIRAAQKLLGAPTIDGRGVPRQGVVVKGVKYASMGPHLPK